MGEIVKLFVLTNLFWCTSRDYPEQESISSQSTFADHQTRPLQKESSKPCRPVSDQEMSNTAPAPRVSALFLVFALDTRRGFSIASEIRCVRLAPWNVNVMAATTHQKGDPPHTQECGDRPTAVPAQAGLCSMSPTLQRPWP